MTGDDSCLRLAGAEVDWLRSSNTSAPEDVLEAMNDPGCRQVLRAVTREPKTAKGIADDCAIPLSTTYRKLRLLTDASLVEERTKISTGGKHAGVYARNFESITIDVSMDGTLELSVDTVENE